MDKNYFLLLHALEKRYDVQKEIIENQEKQIRNLEKMNEALQKEVQLLTEKLDELSSSSAGS